MRRIDTGFSSSVSQMRMTRSSVVADQTCNELLSNFNLAGGPVAHAAIARDTLTTCIGISLSVMVPEFVGGGISVFCLNSYCHVCGSVITSSQCMYVVAVCPVQSNSTAVVYACPIPNNPKFE
jgi:hypothetical protein